MALTGESPEGMEDEFVANAALIAAAPDLLAAALQFKQFHDHCFSAPSKDFDTAWDALMAAIVKATGSGS